MLDDVAIVWPDLYTENEHELSLNRNISMINSWAVRKYFQTMLKTLFAVFKESYLDQNFDSLEMKASSCSLTFDRCCSICHRK